MYRSVWSWSKVKERVLSLRGRLGFEYSDNLRFLKLRLSLSDGRVYDEFTGEHRADIEPLVYYLLHEYAKAEKDYREIGKLIAFKDLYGGPHYMEPFRNRVLRPVERIFGSHPEILIESAEALGGEQVELGDAAARIRALPRIPVIVVVWAGDEEFPPSSNVYFDASITNYYTAEEATVLCEVVVKRLKDALRHLGKVV